MKAPVAGVTTLFKGMRATDDRYEFVQGELNTLVVRVSPPDTGRYTFRLFARAVADTGIYPWILDYTIESSRRLRDFPPYPRKYRVFDDQNARLIEPLSGLLAAGTVQAFRLKVPWAEQAAVVVEGDWTYMQREGEELREMSPSAREALLSARSTRVTRNGTRFSNLQAGRWMK